MMLRPVRWKALLIDLCSLHAATHTCTYANTYTHIQHRLLSVDAARRKYTYSSPWRPPFQRLLSFPYSGKSPRFPQTLAIFLNFISFSFSLPVLQSGSLSLHQFTTHLRHLHCMSSFFFVSLSCNHISHLFLDNRQSPSWLFPQCQLHALDCHSPYLMAIFNLSFACEACFCVFSEGIHFVFS